MGTRLNPSQVIGAWNKEHLKLLKSNLDSKQPLLIPGGGIAMSGAAISAAVDGSTVSVNASGQLTCVVSGGAAYSAGPGIEISNSQISVSVDSSTVGFDSNGALSCMVSGGSGGTSYSAGPGIEITEGGTIMATSSLLNDVTQRISGSGYVVATQNVPGEYMYFNGSGITIGASGVWRTSVGANEAAIRCGASTGIYMSGNVTSMINSGRVHYAAATGALVLYGSSTSTALRLDSVVTMRNRGDDGYHAVIHDGMSATSDSAGIVQPDNSTMIVSGGILSMVPPVTEWTSGNAGSEVTYSQISGAQVLNLYRNGLLMQSGEDYTLSDGVVSYATPLASSEKVAFQYWPVPTPTRGLMKGSPSNDGALPDEFPDEAGER